MLEIVQDHLLFLDLMMVILQLPMLIANGTTTSSVERLRITSDGDAGIGIADPQERLHVARVIMESGCATNQTKC